MNPKSNYVILTCSMGKILIIAVFHKENWAEHLGRAFEKLGYEVDHFDLPRASYFIEPKFKRALKSRLFGRSIFSKPFNKNRGGDR